MKKYKKIFKTSGCRILSNEEIQNINDSMSLLSSDDIKIIEASKEENYSNFNDAHLLLEIMLVHLLLKNFFLAHRFLKVNFH